MAMRPDADSPLIRSLVAASAVFFLGACAQAPAASTPGARPGPAPAEPARPAVQAVPGTARDAFYLDTWSLGFEEPKNRGGTFTYAVSDSTPNLNPFGAQTRTRPFRETAYDQLVARRLSPDTKLLASPIFCRLCESWEVDSGKKSYTFKLRQNVKWHDGQSFTADDVKYTLETAADPKTGYENRSNLTGITSMEIPDRFTIKISTRDPDADFLLKLSTELPVVPKHAADAGTDLSKTVIGTGPFKHGSFNPEVDYVVLRNPDSWLPDRPFVDRVVAQTVKDNSTRLAAFLARQVDVIQVAAKKEIEPIQRQLADVKVAAMDHINVNSFLLNTSRPPFSDKRVRKAVHLALDRDKLADVYAAGVGPKYVAPLTPADWQPKSITREELAKMPGYRQPKEQDIAEAKRLLAEAGYPDGFKTTSMHIGAFIGMPEHNEASSAQLAQVGIEVTILPLEQGTQLKKRSECDFDMSGETMAGSRSNLTRNYTRFLTGGSENYCKYSNPELDRLAAEQARELDENKRWEIVKKIQLLLLEELPSVPFAETVSFSLFQPYVHNWRNYGSAQAYPWYPTVELIWVDKR